MSLNALMVRAFAIGCLLGAASLALACIEDDTTVAIRYQTCDGEQATVQNHNHRIMVAFAFYKKKEAAVRLHLASPWGEVKKSELVSGDEMLYEKIRAPIENHMFGVTTSTCLLAHYRVVSLGTGP